MGRRLTELGVVIATLAIASLSAPAYGGGTAASGFRMPSRNIVCAYLPALAGSYPATLRCDIFSGLQPQPARGCELDWVGISMTLRGRARPTCAGDTVNDPRLPILAYGRTWRRGGFTCLSRKTGLRCTNRSGRGFVLSRERWRVF